MGRVQIQSLLIRTRGLHRPTLKTFWPTENRVPIHKPVLLRSHRIRHPEVRQHISNVAPLQPCNTLLFAGLVPSHSWHRFCDDFSLDTSGIWVSLGTRILEANYFWLKCLKNWPWESNRFPEELKTKLGPESSRVVCFTMCITWTDPNGPKPGCFRGVLRRDTEWKLWVS